jgi:hypothetical protein
MEIVKYDCLCFHNVNVKVGELNRLHIFNYQIKGT